eukprot:Clim_evm1s159 gene=Clim_evmTU1s159
MRFLGLMGRLVAVLVAVIAAVAGYVQVHYDPRIPIRIRVVDSVVMPVIMFGTNMYEGSPFPYSRWFEELIERDEQPEIVHDPPPSRAQNSEDGVVTRDFTSTVHSNKARLFIPPNAIAEVGQSVRKGNAQTRDVLIVYHGGGYMMFSRATPSYDAMCRTIAKRYDMLVLSMDYRMAPEFQYPIPFDDAYSMVEWSFNDKNIVLELERYGADHRKRGIYITGPSAGGGMTNAAMVQILENAQLGKYKVRGLWMAYSFFAGEDRLPTEDQYGKNGVVFHESAARHMLCTLHPPFCGQGINVSAKYLDPEVTDPSIVAQFPPTVHTTGELDFLTDRAIKYCKTMMELGVDVACRVFDGQYHGILNSSELPGCVEHIDFAMLWMLRHAQKQSTDERPSMTEKAAAARL